MKSLRTVYLVSLTILFYGLYNFMQYRLLIFPLPANDFIVLIITAYLLTIEKEARKEGWFILLYAVLLLLQNPYNYEILLDHEHIGKLSGSYFFEIFQLLTILSFIFICIRTFVLKRQHKLSYLILQGLAFYLTGLAFQELAHNFFHLFAFVTLFAFHSIDTHRENQGRKIYLFQAFWLLMAVVRLSFICTVYFLN